MDDHERTSEGPTPITEDALDWTEYEHGHRTFRRKQLGVAAGGRDLGCSLYEVPAGKRTWLPHFHTANEEALYVLDGSGTLYLGPNREEHDLEPGTYAALPASEEGTHEIEAGDGGLGFLVVSTMVDPEIIVYPEHDKLAVFAGTPPGGNAEERVVSSYLDASAEVPYWDEE